MLKEGDIGNYIMKEQIIFIEETVKGRGEGKRGEGCEPHQSSQKRVDPDKEIETVGTIFIVMICNISYHKACYRLFNAFEGQEGEKEKERFQLQNGLKMVLSLAL